jgi:hypothetical protein
MIMNTIIKRYVGYLSLCLTLMGLTGCEGNEMFDKEQYKKVIYVLSEDDLTYGVAHTLNTATSIGYISIYAGGTKPVKEDIVVTLERDENVLRKYNLSNFDLDESKYAKELDPSRYRIENYTAVLKAGAQDPYVKIPVEVRPEGLSPDTTYLIPLKIKDNGTFEMNEDKSRVLYKVYIANDFTSQESPTVLFMRGTQLHEGETKPRQMSANKTLYPLSKRTMRVNAGLENSSGKPTEELINKSSLIMEVKEETATTTNGNNYNPISLKPYNENFIQVELTAAAGDNGQELSIQESNRYLIEDEVIRYYLSYRYRKLKTAATESSEAIWNQWIYVYENMKVLEK